MATDMKKILILGGYEHMSNVVITAKKMGLYTIVTDRMPGSPAKALADESFDISTSDIEALAELIKKETISGVFNGFDDINTWNAQALCEKMDLPFYATKEQLEICSNKDQFKAFCRMYDVPVIEEYEIGENLKETVQQLSFPVIVKPVDSYASQGITVCYSPEEFEEGYAKALNYSKSGKAIVERFIDNSHGVMMFYTVRNGQVTLSAMTDRYVHKHYQEHPPLPTATLFPSRHLDLYVQTLDQKVRAMLQGMGIQNGVLFIQSLFENDAFYLYEMGFRMSGTQYYSIVEKQTGINLLEMMLDYATGGTLENYPVEKFDNGYTKFPACNLSILLKDGVIKEITGLEEIIAMPAVLAYIPVNDTGDTVEITGTYAQMLGRFNIAAENTDELTKIINHINSSLQVTSTDGSDMIAAKYNPAETDSQQSSAS